MPGFSVQKKQPHKDPKVCALFPKAFYFNKTAGKYTYKGKQYRGLIRVVEAAFCPPGKTSELVHDLCHRIVEASASDAASAISLKSSTKKSAVINKGDVFKWGAKIHAEVAQFVNWGASDDSKFTSQTMDIVAGLMTTLKLTLVAANVPVYSTAHEVGTEMDVLARKADGTWVVVELKTGTLEAYETSFGKMLYPLQDVALSKKNLHQLQLMGTLNLFKMTDRFEKMLSTVKVEGLVFFLEYKTNTTKIFPLEDWALSETCTSAFVLGMKDVEDLREFQIQHFSTDKQSVAMLVSSRKKQTDQRQDTATASSSSGSSSKI